MRFPTFAAREEHANSLAIVVEEGIALLCDESAHWSQRDPATWAIIRPVVACIDAAAHTGAMRSMALGPERDGHDARRRELLRRAVAELQRALES